MLNQNSKPLISVIIPTYNGLTLLRPCLKSIIKSTYPQWEVIIIDNASTDGTKEYCTKLAHKYTWIKTITNETNCYFAKAVNQGIKVSRGTYILILNNDTFLSKNALINMIRKMEEDRNIGAVHPKIIAYPSGNIDTIGGKQDIFGFSYKQNKVSDSEQKLFYVGIGLFRKSLLNRIGCFDDDFVIFWEDVDLSWRIHLSGYTVKRCLNAVIYHRVSTSTKKLPLSIGNYHLRKNRIAGLIKNLYLRNLLLILPLTLTIMSLLSIFELIKYRSLISLINTFRAYYWNVINIKKTLKKRRYIQHNIRKISDIQVMKHMIVIPS